jgi:hypothetical protein
MLDVWKIALENLLYSPPSPTRERDALRAMARARQLVMLRSLGDLRRHYAHLHAGKPDLAGRDDVHRDGLSPRQVEDAAFGLRHLEIVTGRPMDPRAREVMPWVLATAG